MPTSNQGVIPLPPEASSAWSSSLPPGPLAPLCGSGSSCCRRRPRQACGPFHHPVSHPHGAAKNASSTPILRVCQKQFLSRCLAEASSAATRSRSPRCLQACLSRVSTFCRRGACIIGVTHSTLLCPAVREPGM
jgi:hypothetical protein